MIACAFHNHFPLSMTTFNLQAYRQAERLPARGTDTNQRTASKQECRAAVCTRPSSISPLFCAFIALIKRAGGNLASLYNVFFSNSMNSRIAGESTLPFL